MTDGEKKQWERDLLALQIGAVKVVEGSQQWLVYATAVMVLGAVLDHEQYRKAYENVVGELRELTKGIVTG